MFTVKKLADSLGVGPDVVRHYTALGLLEPAVNPWTGYRTYRGIDALLLGSDRSLRSLEPPLQKMLALLPSRRSPRRQVESGRKMSRIERHDDVMPLNCGAPRRIHRHGSRRPAARSN